MKEATGTIGDAINGVIKEFQRWTRTGWNGYGLHIELINDDMCCNGAWIGLYKDGALICPWTASQSDLMASDWAKIATSSTRR